MLHLQISEVEDLVENLVTVFREGVTHFVEELDSKLQSEFQSLEQRETQLRVERQALDELRKSLKEEKKRLDSKSCRKRTSQLQVRFDELDKDQIVSPGLAADFLVNAETDTLEASSSAVSSPTSSFQRQSIMGSYCKRAPKPWEIVSIAGHEYATLPPKCPEEQEREHLKNAVVALPDGWELLSTDARGFSFIIDELSRHSWGNPLLAAQCQSQPRLFATYRTAMSTRGRAGSRYRSQSRHVVSPSAKELPIGAAQDSHHLRFCHDFGRLVIRKKLATE